MNIEQLLPSARPKFTQYAFEVIKPGSLWWLRVEQSPYQLSTARKTRTEKKKIDIVE